jgi:hypothetical protein
VCGEERYRGAGVVRKRGCRAQLDVSEAGLSTAGSKPRPSNLTLFGAATGGLLLLNAALLFTSSSPLTPGVRVFYWQHFNNFLYPLRFWGLIAALVCIAIWVPIFFRRRRKLSAYVMLFTAACGAGACLFINYWSVFGSGFVESIDSINFNGHTYELAAYSNFRPTSISYLGECDQTGTTCVFWGIYAGDGWGGPSRLSISNDGRSIVASNGNWAIYRYDGVRGYCNIDPIHDPFFPYSDPCAAMP